MTERLRALPRDRFEVRDKGFAETSVVLRHGVRRFGTLLVHENDQDGDWSVALEPTSLELRRLTIGTVAEFMRAQLPEFARLDDEAILVTTRPRALVYVDGTHRRYNLASQRERAWFTKTLARVDPEEQFARIDVRSSRSPQAAGGVLWFESNGVQGRGVHLGVGRYGREWTPELARFLLDHHAGGPAVSAEDLAATLQTTFEDITTRRSIDGLQVARDFHLRRSPVAVRARGRAVVAPDGFDAEIDRMSRGFREVLGVSRPGNHTAAPADHALLLVPLTANARAYPRSINRTQVSLLRVPPPKAL